MEVLLREYVNELRGLILAGHYSDALTLGQHILHYYPKHIETYRLLGEASLETDDVRGATDLFRRVLSSDPENIIALGGMALIFEEQGKLDQAMWHLERAYEIQPMNPELQKEFQRVQREFQGTSAPSLKLTPGALARTHARAGLLKQAIQEFHHILRSDDQRYDIQVALAETLYHAGQMDQAGELAETVLEEAPYCLKANLLLGVLWSQNGVAEGEMLLRRAQEMDPENGTARTIFGKRFADSPIPRLPGLQAEPGATPPPSPTSPVVSTSLTEFTSTKPDSNEVTELTLADELNISDRNLQEELVAPLASATAFMGALERREEVSYEDLEGSPVSDSMFSDGAVATSAPVVISPTTNDAIDRTELVNQTEKLAVSEPNEDKQADTATISELEVAGQESATIKSNNMEPSVPSVALTSASASLIWAGTDGKEKASDDENSEIGPTDNKYGRAADESRESASAQAFHIPGLSPIVRPTIRGAGEKLPAWLRLGGAATSASAITSESEPQVEAIAPQGLTIEQKENDPIAVDRIEPLKPVVVRASRRSRESMQVAGRSSGEQLPDLGDAPQASPSVNSEPIAVPRDEEVKAGELPAWLEPTGINSTTADVDNLSAHVNEANTAQSIPVLPAWLVVEEAKRVETTGPLIGIESGLESAGELEHDAAVTSVGENSTVSVNIQDLEPAAHLDTPTLNQEQVHAGTKPDGHMEDEQPTAPESRADLTASSSSEDKTAPSTEALLQQARQKRAHEDLLGAIDLYEKVMHRRPNYLDEVTADLEEINHLPNAPIEAHRLLGEAYAMAGRFKEALDQYRLALNKQ